MPSVLEGTKDAGKATWGAMRSGAKAIGDTAGQAWDGAKDIAGKGWKALKVSNLGQLGTGARVCLFCPRDRGLL